MSKSPNRLQTFACQKILLRNVEDGTLVEWTLSEILYEVNRDHSDQWTDYDTTDWQEGLEEWTEWRTFEP